MMSESTVIHEERGAVAIVTLNRPQALNSVNRQMHHDLWPVLDAVQANPAIRALVLTGAGRAFCAGADLASLDLTPGPDLARRADPTPLIEEQFNPTVRRLLALRMPSIAAVNGVAAGAGASLAMLCDITIAAPGASFIQAFSKIGLVPDAGGSWLLPQRLGLARAMGLALTADKLPAAQARDWGLIWDVADDPLAAAIALAQRLAGMPTKALVATRALLRSAQTRSLEEQLNAERDTQAEMGATQDFIEGVLAFQEKRAPRFTGQ